MLANRAASSPLAAVNRTTIASGGSVDIESPQCRERVVRRTSVCLTSRLDQVRTSNISTIEGRGTFDRFTFAGLEPSYRTPMKFVKPLILVVLLIILILFCQDARQ